MLSFKRISIAIAALCLGAAACAGDEPEAAEFREWCVDPPAAELADRGADAVMSLVPDAPLGLGDNLTAMVNGQVVDLRDDGAEGDAAAADDVYSVPVALADIDAPTEHTCFPVEDGLISERGIDIECKTVPCPSDCKSILFGDPCVICLECTFKVSLLSGPQKN